MILKHKENGMLYKLTFKDDGSIFICPFDDYGVPNGQIIYWTEEEIQKTFTEVNISYEKGFRIVKEVQILTK
jgi:hypothetical protein